MAGIGFDLQKLLEGDTYFDTVKAHLYSVLISAGPWVLSILTLFCLNLFAPENIDIFELTYFRTAIIYAFAFSLIVAGVVQLVLTRYIADRLYLKEKNALIPAFNSAVLILLSVQLLSALPYFFFSDESVFLKGIVILIYLAIGVLWLVMTLLSAMKDFEAIIFAFVAGSVAAFGAAYGLGHCYGLEGYLTGYLLGHLLIVGLLSARVFIEFPSIRYFDWTLIRFMAEKWELVVIGIVYNAAIWIDKIIFWMSPRAMEVTRVLRTYPFYESAVFFAYLTVIPALAVFLLEVETSFYKRYRAFFLEILGKGTYSEIERKKGGISKSLSHSLGLVIRYQGLISLLFITFAPEFASLLHMPLAQVPVFRIAVLGAFLHSLLLVMIIVTLYFDFKPLAMTVCLVFFLSNGFFTFITSKLAMPFLGYGYLASCLVSLAFAYYTLNSKLKRLEFLTFAPQPIGVHREEEIW